MKRNYIVLAAGALLAFSAQSCEKYLDLEPHNQSIAITSIHVAATESRMGGKYWLTMCRK